MFCLGTNNNYELLEKDDIPERVTLVNSRRIGNKNIPDTLHEIDGTDFVTAHEQPIRDTMENELVQFNKRIRSPRVKPKQTDILCEKV